MDDEENPPETHYLKLDCTKARNKLSWSPKLDLRNALEWAVEWYKSYQKGENIRNFTESQIELYETIDAKVV